MRGPSMLLLLSLVTGCDLATVQPVARPPDHVSPGRAPSRGRIVPFTETPSGDVAVGVRDGVVSRRGDGTWSVRASFLVRNIATHPISVSWTQFVADGAQPGEGTTFPQGVPVRPNEAVAGEIGWVMTRPDAPRALAVRYTVPGSVAPAWGASISLGPAR